jgi:hypothetical protein
MEENGRRRDWKIGKDLERSWSLETQNRIQWRCFVEALCS